jgi:DNA-binding response OmpR family regulator
MSRKTKIMVVDDEEGLREAVSVILQQAGYLIVEARNGEECLRYLREGFRGLLLMDVMMPVLDGWDTIRTMAHENLMEGNLICMLTAMREPGAKARGIEEHVLDYLPKPFKVKELLKMVENSSQYLAA